MRSFSYYCFDSHARGGCGYGCNLYNIFLYNNIIYMPTIHDNAYIILLYIYVCINIVRAACPFVSLRRNSNNNIAYIINRALEYT